MPNADWRLEGQWLKNCNCAWGCPCNFNGKPTQGNCVGVIGMRIGKGHFDGTPLDGLGLFALISFPGPLYEGNGQLQPVIDERASAEQRAALLAILSGRHSADGTLFRIYSLITSKVHEAIYAPMSFEFDKAARTARLVVPGVLETEVESIRHPISGAAHRIQVVTPQGFEHREAEVASSDIRSHGAIAFETHGGHSTLADVVQTPGGVASRAQG